jgi:hypothetical protein
VNPDPVSKTNQNKPKKEGRKEREEKRKIK